MISVAELCSYLAQSLDGVEVRGATERLGAVELERVSTDQSAAAGSLAWLSSRVARSEPQRVAAFGGTCLIVPDGVELPDRGDVVYVTLPDPKLGIATAIEYGFAELIDLGLPGLGEGSISEAAVIDPSAFVSPGAVIGAGVVVARGAWVGPNSVLVHTTVGEGSSIGANCTIGLPGFGWARDAAGLWRRFPHIGGVVIEADVHVGSNVSIDRGAIGNTILRSGSRIDNLVHVAHNVVVGSGTLVIANSMLGGSAHLEEDVWVEPSVSVMNQARVGRGAVLGMGAVVLRGVESGKTVVGNPAKVLDRN